MVDHGSDSFSRDSPATPGVGSTVRSCHLERFGRQLCKQYYSVVLWRFSCCVSATAMEPAQADCAKYCAVCGDETGETRGWVYDRYSVARDVGFKYGYCHDDDSHGYVSRIPSRGTRASPKAVEVRYGAHHRHSLCSDYKRIWYYYRQSC